MDSITTWYIGWLAEAVYYQVDGVSVCQPLAILASAILWYTCRRMSNIFMMKLAVVAVGIIIFFLPTIMGWFLNV